MSIVTTHLSIAPSSKIVKCSPDAWFTESDQANDHDLEERRPIESCESIE
jgi:hypothetical protein